MLAAGDAPADDTMNSSKFIGSSRGGCEEEAFRSCAIPLGGFVLSMDFGWVELRKTVGQISGVSAIA